MKAFILCLIVLVGIGLVTADVYLQGIIPGSNNRLNEQGATRANNNRLFNSQNNNRGGYNCGEIGQGTCNDSAQSPNMDYNPDNFYTTNGQYARTYYEGSEVVLAWTNQHGCGGNPLTDPHNTHCNIIIQYTCDTDHEDQQLFVKLLNGVNTGTPNTANINDCKNNRSANTDEGRHESVCNYAECAVRQRNKGLFTADQQLKDDVATHTRQNPGGGRSGLECEEERDYYPYWGPSPWRDVAYLTSELDATNIDPCAMVAAGTQNTNKIYKCRPRAGVTNNNNAYKAITAEECADADGDWVGFSWNIPTPECKQAPWSRDNHLGSSRDGHYTNYTWTIPTMDQLFSGDGVNKPATLPDIAKCVVRVRYNITTADYDPWNTFAESNAPNSPVTNNPRVDIGGGYPLRLALNTAQTGRTFQDRSHVFTIRKRPAAFQNKRIVNLNMIGKRCNIVECYPAVEYYWIPTQPVLQPGELLHIQWDGSNTENNNGNPGDGQAGDSGQGQGGTSRHNFLVKKSESHNWPLPLDKFNDTLFDKSTCWRPLGTSASTTPRSLDRNQCAMTLATAGFYTDLALTLPTGATAVLNEEMNNGPPAFINGVVLQPNEVGKYYFIDTRDNNFTNRDQKGVLHVVPPQ